MLPPPWRAEVGEMASSGGGGLVVEWEEVGPIERRV